MKFNDVPVRLFSLSIACFAAVNPAPGLTILSGPSFTPATNAPLAGTLQVTTDVPSRVTVSMSDGTNSWDRRFYDYSTTHSVPVLGFRPNRTNEIMVEVSDRFDNQMSAASPLTFVTAPLPNDFPTIVLLHSNPYKMEP